MASQSSHAHCAATPAFSRSCAAAAASSFRPPCPFLRWESVVPPPQILQEAPVLILVEPLELLHAADPSADERLLGDHASVVIVPIGVRPVRRVRVGRALRLRGVDVVVGVDGELHRRGEPAVGFRPSPRAARPSSPSSSSAASRFMEPGRGARTREARAVGSARRTTRRSGEILGQNARNGVRAGTRNEFFGHHRLARTNTTGRARSGVRKAGHVHRQQVREQSDHGSRAGRHRRGAVGAVYGTYESFAYKVRRRCLLARDLAPTADPARRARTDAGGTANLTVSPPRRPLRRFRAC